MSPSAGEVARPTLRVRGLLGRSEPILITGGRAVADYREAFAGRHHMFQHLLPPPGDSEVISHFERLSSNETKIAPRSERGAVRGSDR